MSTKSKIEIFYNKWEGTIQLLILILIPLVVYLYGENVKRAAERDKTEQNYVRIATGILAQKVKEGDDQVAIRSWAADVLQKYSPVKLDEEQRDKLVSGESVLAPFFIEPPVFFDRPGDVMETLKEDGTEADGQTSETTEEDQ